MLRTYDSRKVLISLGSHSVSEYADGSFVSIEAHGDGVEKKVGADGEVIRSIDPDECRDLLRQAFHADTPETVNRIMKQALSRRFPKELPFYVSMLDTEE